MEKLVLAMKYNDKTNWLVWNPFMHKKINEIKRQNLFIGHKGPYKEEIQAKKNKEACIMCECLN